VTDRSRITGPTDDLELVVEQTYGGALDLTTGILSVWWIGFEDAS
jgi:hypothetical protein